MQKQKGSVLEDITNLGEEFGKIAEALQKQGIKIIRGYSGENSLFVARKVFCEHPCKIFASTYAVSGLKKSEEKMEEEGKQMEVERIRKCKCRQAIALIKEVGEPLTVDQLWYGK